MFIVGRIYIQRKPMEMTALKQELPDVRLGGLWNPTECIPKAKVHFKYTKIAIILFYNTFVQF